MQDLIKQEQFELEVLDKLNSKKLLNNLIFGGGTMLRLCFGLNRFSVDLDFWIIKDIDMAKLYKEMWACLEKSYKITDTANKFYTILFELKSVDYPRSLKIEIRKEVKQIQYEEAIAYSKHSNIQVFLKIIKLQDMMKAKLKAFLDRKEIRDIFDIEFLLKKGVSLTASKEDTKKALEIIDSFTKKDYQVKLGSLLEEKQRKYYIASNFKIIKMTLNGNSD
ncbi:MAG: nucleotidyl transferase AbiEii/AbiGii toxin family protein [Candidatus Omnitrophota bacterium]